MAAASQSAWPGAGRSGLSRTMTASTIAPETNLMPAKLTGSISPRCSASRHSSELAAKASIATAVSTVVCKMSRPPRASCMGHYQNDCPRQKRHAEGRAETLAPANVLFDRHHGGKQEHPAEAAGTEREHQ